METAKNKDRLCIFMIQFMSPFADTIVREPKI